MMRRPPAERLGLPRDLESLRQNRLPMPWSKLFYFEGTWLCTNKNPRTWTSFVDFCAKVFKDFVVRVSANWQSLGFAEANILGSASFGKMVIFWFQKLGAPSDTSWLVEDPNPRHLGRLERQMFLHYLKAFFERQKLESLWQRLSDKLTGHLGKSEHKNKIIKKLWTSMGSCFQPFTSSVWLSYFVESVSLKSVWNQFCSPFLETYWINSISIHKLCGKTMWFPGHAIQEVVGAARSHFHSTVGCAAGDRFDRLRWGQPIATTKLGGKWSI